MAPWDLPLDLPLPGIMALLQMGYGPVCHAHFKQVLIVNAPTTSVVHLAQNLGYQMQISLYCLRDYLYWSKHTIQLDIIDHTCTRSLSTPHTFLQ